MLIETVLILVAVLAGAAWIIRRSQAARADREAMHTYGHALEVLADITHTRDPYKPPGREKPVAGHEDEDDPATDEAEQAEQAEQAAAQTEDFSHLPPPPDPIGDNAPDEQGTDEQDTDKQAEEEPAEEPSPAPIPAAQGRTSSTVRKILIDREDDEKDDADEADSELVGAASHAYSAPSGSLQPKVELRPPPIRWAAPRRKRAVGGRALAAVAGLALIGGAVGIAMIVTGDDGDQTTATDSPTTTAEDETEPPATEPEEPPPTEPEGPIEPDELTGDVAAFGVPTPFELTLAASAPCWVSLSDAAGNILLEETLQDGEERTIEITDGASLRVGNAGALTVTANGNELAHGGGPGQPLTLEMGVPEA